MGGLRTLSIAGNEITDEGIRSLANARSLTNLTSLNLSRNPLGPVGAARLAQSSNFSRLTALTLRDCELGPDGARALASSVHFRGLRSLDLYGNDIRGGAIAVAGSKTLGQLESLELGANDIDASGARAFAESRGATLVEVSVPGEYGFDIPTGSRQAKRTPCSACGLSKRHLFDQAAIDGGYDVVVTGHNLDDEAAVLFGNVLHWQAEYLGRQLPVLPARDGFPRKVKPLVRLSERETAAYAFLRKIDYVVEECPLVGGNTQLRYKAAMNQLEQTSPGTKAQFLMGFIDKGAALFKEEDQVDLSPCERCGQPTTARFCAFCRARAQVLGERLGAPRDDAQSDDEGQVALVPRGTSWAGHVRCGAHTSLRRMVTDTSSMSSTSTNSSRTMSPTFSKLKARIWVWSVAPIPPPPTMPMTVEARMFSSNV